MLPTFPLKETNHPGQQATRLRYAALPDGANFHLATGLRCPHCSRELQPYDIDILENGWRLMCSSCFATLAERE